jgi:hypothetical protein
MARLGRQWRPKRRYEHLRLLATVTRMEYECLGGPALKMQEGRDPSTDPMDGGEPDEEALAEWARPWGWSCIFELRSKLNRYGPDLDRSRRRLPAAAREDAERRADERFVEIVERVASTLEAEGLA